MWTNEIKTKTKPSSHWRRAILFDLAYRQCNDIIKGWLHCLTSESKGRFFVNNILMFDHGDIISPWFNSTRCLVMAQIQFSLIKEIKIKRPEHSLTPQPIRPITSRFTIIHHSPPQSGRHMCITTNWKKQNHSVFVFKCNKATPSLSVLHWK